MNRRKDVREVPGTTRYRWNTVKAVFIWAILWMAVGGVVVAEWHVWPNTLLGWLLWSAAAPILYVLLELVGGVLIEGPLRLAARIPPLSWLVRWLRCDDGVADPLLRFGALAVGFLALFFVALKVIYGYP